MKIGFDVSQTGKNKAGCGHFAESLVRKLLEIDADNIYFLYSTFGNSYCDPEHEKTTYRSEKNNCIPLLGELSHRAALDYWNSATIDEEKLGYPDIVHANNFSCPRLSRAKIVYTLHDLSFIDRPEFTTEENRFKCFNGVFDSALYADFVIAVSEYSQDRFLKIFPHFPRERIRTIYLGSRFEGEIAERAVPNLTVNEFWLSVGTLEPRKNLRRTLQAYKSYAEIHHGKPLVLAGGKGWLENDLEEFIQSLGLTEKVRLLGYVDDPTLKWLYKNCYSFVYPSIYEGFGLPVLEAMSLGAATIASNATSLPEVGGDALWYVNPTSVPELVRAFEKLADPMLRDRLQSQSRDRARTFSWTKTARQVLEIYAEVLEMKPRKLDRP